MRDHFDSGITRSYEFRKEQLLKLKKAVLKYEKRIHEALYADLKKSAEECWVTETGFLLAEISHTLKHLQQWMKPEKVRTNLLNLPSKSYVVKEPMGVVLIIGPWNYPVQLLLTPLVGAIAAGNCTVLKPSEFAPACAAVLKELIEETFEKDHIRFVEGDGAVAIPAMMDHFVFDHVFYTGSTTVGKIIYKMAAKALVPVTLELGGKSPCVIEADADLRVAARRIAVAKFSNAGQMCVTPDYILIHESKKDEFVSELKKTVLDFFGEDPMQNLEYGKIINEKQFNRLIYYLEEVRIIHGGAVDKENLFIAPTIVDEVTMHSAIMNEEIFGPVLPVITFSSFEEARNIILKNPNPLAFYVFTQSREMGKKWTETIPFGGGCINNVSWHLTNPDLPFGGRGNSGIGNYHGKNSFDTFTQRKGIMKRPVWFDADMKYPPLKGKLKLFKWIIR